MCLATAPMWSQGRFGIKGGLNFNSLKDVSDNASDTWNRQTGYHMGLTWSATRASLYKKANREQP